MLFQVTTKIQELLFSDHDSSELLLFPKKNKQLTIYTKTRFRLYIYLFVLSTERVSDYKNLEGGLLFLQELPRSPSGKILRRQLKELAKSKL